jgi:hypothetical protein
MVQQKGNLDAIAILLNRSLEPQGITATVERKDTCLYISLVSVQIPARQELVLFIRKKLISIGSNSIKTAKIYGRQLGQVLPAWQQDIDLEIQPTIPLLLKGAIAALLLMLGGLFVWLFWPRVTTSSKSVIASPSVSPELIASPSANLNSDSLEFDAQKVGTSSKLKTITLTNYGLGTLKIKEVSVTGANADEFQLSDKCVDVSISEKANCTIDIIFTPKAAKEREALLTITDNTADSPHKVLLNGLGTPPQPITSQPIPITQPTAPTLIQEALD